jgi:probable rRNA maturation factor
VGLTEAALARFVLRAKKAARLRGTVNVLLTSSAAVRALNRQFRGQNKATDVLSFPSVLPQSPKAAQLVGEIAISADMAVQSAARLGHSAAEEVKILALHGILHLAGFDHERDNGEMALKESKLRQALGLPTGLIERAGPSARKSLSDPSTTLRARPSTAVLRGYRHRGRGAA